MWWQAQIYFFLTSLTGPSPQQYRKSTHMDKYLDFESHHPLSHKKSVVSTLLARVRSHFSSTSTATAELNHIMCALQSNGYPKAFSCVNSSQTTTVNDSVLKNHQNGSRLLSFPMFEVSLSPSGGFWPDSTFVCVSNPQPVLANCSLAPRIVPLIWTYRVSYIRYHVLNALHAILATQSESCSNK